MCGLYSLFGIIMFAESGAETFVENGAGGIISEVVYWEEIICRTAGGAKIHHIYPEHFASIFHKPFNLTL